MSKPSRKWLTGAMDRVFALPRMERLVQFQQRNRIPILAISLLVSVLAAWIVSGIGLNSSLTALLPQSTPSILRVDTLRAKIGGMGDLIVMVESRDPTKSIAYANELLAPIQGLPWVDHAEMGRNDSVFAKKKLLFMDLDDLEDVDFRVHKYIRQKTQKSNPLFVDLTGEEEARLDFSDIEARYQGANSLNRLYQNADGTILLIVVRPKGMTSDIAFARTIYDNLVRTVKMHPPADPTIHTSVGGTYKNRLDEYDTILSDVGSSFLLGIALIALLLFLYFRKVSWVAILITALFMGLSWTFAIARLTVGDLNLITAFLAVVLFGLGIDFGIHILTRYRSMRREGMLHAEALAKALHLAGRASFTAAATTAVAFFSLTFSDFLGFRDFGWIAGIGILCTYSAYIFVFPTLLSLWEKIHPWRVPLNAVMMAHPAQAGRTSRKAAWSILAVGILMSVASIGLINRVEFENDFRNLRAKVQQSRVFNDKVNQVFTQARDPSAVLVSGREEAAKVRSYLESRHLMDSSGPVESIKSIQTIVPDDQEDKLELLAGIYNLLERNRPLVPEADRHRIDSLCNLLTTDSITLEEIPEELRRPFLGLPGTTGQVLYIYQRHSLMDIRNARVFADAVGSFEVEGKTYHAISEPIIYVDLVRVLERDSAIAVVLVFLMLFLVVFLDLQQVKATLLSLAPTAIGFLWMFGLMPLLGIKLNLFNLVVLPSILGLAVDAGVHIYHRFQELGSGSIRTALVETGGASLLSSATTMGGFGSLLMASHPGLRSLGELAIAGMGTSLVASLVFLPALLVVLRKDPKP